MISLQRLFQSKNKTKMYPLVIAKVLMKIHIPKLITTLLVFSCSFSVIAQKSMPTANPNFGSIELRYRPTFSATCFANSEGKGANDWIAKQSTSGSKRAVKRESDGSLYTMIEYSDNGTNVITKLSLTDDGIPRKVKPVATYSGNPPSQEMLLFSEKMAPLLERSAEFFGQSFYRGKRIDMQMCRYLDATQSSFEGSFEAIGLTQMASRQGLLFAGSATQTCRLNNQVISLKFSGWNVVDVDSGIEISSSMRLDFGAENKNLGYTITNSDCQIVGAAEVVQTKSHEERLKELRRLLDTGLINKQQYDVKASEILKGL